MMFIHTVLANQVKCLEEAADFSSKAGDSTDEEVED